MGRKTTAGVLEGFAPGGGKTAADYLEIYLDLGK